MPAATAQRSSATDGRTIEELDEELDEELGAELVEELEELGVDGCAGRCAFRPM